MRVVVADLEADGLLHEATQVWCAVFKDIHTKEVTQFRPDQVPQMLSFMDSCDVCIMHNGVGYDWPLLEKLYGFKYKGKKVDTLLMSRLQVPERPHVKGCKSGPHSIEAWGMRLGRHKPSHEDWSRFSEEMMTRCTEDVEITHLTLDALLSEGRGYNWKPAHLLTKEVFEVLHLQEEYGWLLDMPYAERCISLLTHFIRKIDLVSEPYLPYITVRPSKSKGEYHYYKKPYTKAGKLQHYVLAYCEQAGIPDDHTIAGPFSKVEFRKVSLNSNDETKNYLLSEGWVPETWNYNDAGERTSPKLSQDDDFVGVDGKLGRLIAKRVILRHRRSQMQGWIDRVRPDGRVPQVVTGICTTSRLKHSGIVNVPGSDKVFGAPMRKVFISKPGHKIVGVDSASCQLRMLCARMGDPEYTHAVVNGDKDKGDDIHTVNMQRAGLDTRAQAKTFIYGFLFGSGDAKTGSIIGGSAAAGKALKAKFLEGLPKLQELISKLTEEWRSNAKWRRNKWGSMEPYNGWVTGLDGRPVYITSEHKVLVFVLQSDEAILMQTAVTLLHRWLQERGWVHGVDYGFCAHAHDEFQVEVPDHRVQEYKELAERSIAEAGIMLGIDCPHEGEADVGINWCETH